MLLLFHFPDCPQPHLALGPLSSLTPHHESKELGPGRALSGCVVRPPLCVDEDIQIENASNLSQVSKTILETWG